MRSDSRHEQDLLPLQRWPLAFNSLQRTDTQPQLVNVPQELCQQDPHA
jgi:hypothetical protein